MSLIFVAYWRKSHGCLDFSTLQSRGPKIMKLEAQVRIYLCLFKLVNNSLLPQWCSWDSLLEILVHFSLCRNLRWGWQALWVSWFEPASLPAFVTPPATPWSCTSCIPLRLIIVAPAALPRLQACSYQEAESYVGPVTINEGSDDRYNASSGLFVGLRVRGLLICSMHGSYHKRTFALFSLKALTLFAIFSLYFPKSSHFICPHETSPFVFFFPKKLASNLGPHSPSIIEPTY